MVLKASGLTTHRWNNNWRSAILLALYPILIGFTCWSIIYVVCVVFEGEKSKPLPSLHTVYDVSSRPSEQIKIKEAYRRDEGAVRPTKNEKKVSNAQRATDLTLDTAPVIISVIALWFLIAGLWHGRMMQMMSGSKPLSRVQEPELYNLLENLCIAQGVPMPRLCIIETDARNAFASGMTDKTYTITVTQGLLYHLKKDEVEAVLAHELAHIRNNDVRLLVTSIIFCGLFGLLAQMTWRIIQHGIRGTGKDTAKFILVLVAANLILWVGYFMTVWSRFALSRVREYDADAMAVEMTKNPDALMRALMRIDRRERLPNIPDDIALMCIGNRSPFLGLFRTHPPMKKRIEVLSSLTNTPIPDAAPLLRPLALEERFSKRDPGDLSYAGVHKPFSNEASLAAYRRQRPLKTQADHSENQP